jgi:hypothetical protein
MAGPLISPIEHPSEAFECLDCFLVDTLNEHGRCTRCGSNAVMPYMVLEKAGRWIKAGDAHYWVSTEQPYQKAEGSNPRIPEQPRHCRTIARSNTPKPARAGNEEKVRLIRVNSPLFSETPSVLRSSGFLLSSA